MDDNNKSSLKDIIIKNKKAYISVFVCLFVAYAFLAAGITNTGTQNESSISDEDLSDDDISDGAADSTTDGSIKNDIDGGVAGSEAVGGSLSSTDEAYDEETSAGSEGVGGSISASEEAVNTETAGSSKVDVTTESDAGIETGAGSETELDKASEKENMVAFDEEAGIILPLDGEIIMSYSMDHTVYYETLGQFMTSDGLLIDAKHGDMAVSCCEGVVSAVYTDTRRGLCVEITAGDYTFTYGQLASVSVSEGSIIKQGTAVGMVGEPTKYFISEGTHLYFRAEYGDEAIDPLSLLVTG